MPSCVRATRRLYATPLLCNATHARMLLAVWSANTTSVCNATIMQRHACSDIDVVSSMERKLCIGRKKLLLSRKRPMHEREWLTPHPMPKVYIRTHSYTSKCADPAAVPKVRVQDPAMRHLERAAHREQQTVDSSVGRADDCSGTR